MVDDSGHLWVTMTPVRNCPYPTYALVDPTGPPPDPVLALSFLVDTGADVCVFPLTALRRLSSTSSIPEIPLLGLTGPPVAPCGSGTFRIAPPPGAPTSTSPRLSSRAPDTAHRFDLNAPELIPGP